MAPHTKAAVLVSGGALAGSSSGNSALVFKVTQEIIVSAVGCAMGNHMSVNPSAVYLTDYANHTLAFGPGYSNPAPGLNTWVMTEFTTPLTLQPGTYALIQLGGYHDRTGTKMDVDTSGGAVVPYAIYSSTASLSTSIFSNSGTESEPVPSSSPSPESSWIESRYTGGGVYGFATMRYTVVPETEWTGFAVAGVLAGLGCLRHRKACNKAPVA